MQSANCLQLKYSDDTLKLLSNDICIIIEFAIKILVEKSNFQSSFLLFNNRFWDPIYKFKKSINVNTSYVYYEKQ